MEFTMEKYAMFIMKNFKCQKTQGAELHSQGNIRKPREEEPNKSFGTLEADTIKQTVMKEK